MNLVANDIVDLNDPFNRRSFSNQRYLNKILTKKEIAFISEHRVISHLPQIFWSAKEAAYKLMVKHGLKLRFNPACFEVSAFTNVGEYCDRVFSTITYNHHAINLQSSCTAKYVHTWVDSKYRNSEMKVKVITKKNREDAHSAVINDLSVHLKLAVGHLKIVKDCKTNIPTFQIGKNKEIEGFDFSLSHDGAFIAYVLNS